MKKLLVMVASLTMLLLYVTTLSFAEDLEINQPPGKAPAALLDLLVIKPAATLGATATTMAFLGSLPVTYPLERDLQVAEYLVHYPWTYAADRPLGILCPGKNIAVRIDERISEQYLDYFVEAGANRSPLGMK